jgi:serine phosphatase RsbU (regulator of sigma subunit)/anti-sigma regulatory factor (Ser/Thr protein kinase)
MAVRMQSFWRTWIRRDRGEPQVGQTPVVVQPQRVDAPALSIAPNDPIIMYFQSVGGAVEIDKLELDSPALQAMKAAGMRLAVPLVSQGELIGLINLGRRLSEQDYSTDDRGLLNNLATQAAPALRVAQLVRQQQVEARERERIEQELRIARLIQQTLLPKELPTLSGWQVAAHYQPAREVGGDFYDFLHLPDGRLGLVIGDVTDKGVPAALVMATTRSILRAVAQRFDSPGEVLKRVNDLLDPDIPPNMFVTCLYAILDPASGRLQYANAGHDLPYRRHDGGVAELRATGMPLGLMPGMHYEEKEIVLEPGESVLFYSDGLVEAHNPQREMFSFPRLRQLVASHSVDGGATLVDFLLAELEQFAGTNWEQEDDITLVTLQRSASAVLYSLETSKREDKDTGDMNGDQGDGAKQVLAEFNIPSAPGNERQAMQQVAAVVGELDIAPWTPSARRLERLKTAVAEATMNAMEHGNNYRAESPVSIQVLGSKTDLVVRITDHGNTQQIMNAESPDLEAKLANLQTPRGWGLFLIKNMVDEMNVTNESSHHTIELIMHRKGEDHVSQTA